MTRPRLTFPDRILFSHDVSVRISDLNYGKHLGHDRYLSLVHEARAWFFRSFGAEEWDCDGCSMMVVDLAASFSSEAFFGQVLGVDVAVGERSSARCDLFYRLTERESGNEVAIVTTGIVFVDCNRRVVRLPRSFAEAVKA